MNRKSLTLGDPVRDAPPRSRRRGVSIGAVLGALLVATACGGPAPSLSPAPQATPTTAASPSASAAAIATQQPTSSGPARPIGTTGRVALLSEDGSLSMVDAGGHLIPMSLPADGNFGFPTWSPDGSLIAAPRISGTDRALVVFDADGLASGRRADPRVIFQAAAVEPFYLYWTPDGQAVSFLASQGGALTLRIAPADGSAPVDGSGPGALVRAGNPFYYDWIGRDRLLAHIGLGSDGFLGEIGLNGKAVGKGLGNPGDFRSAVVSRDRKSIAFVRDKGSGSGEIVVAARDGSGEHAISVFGSAAVIFDPAGDTLAGIGPVEPQPPAGFPVGPIRLIDTASGKVRTLIDGSVVGFWWSPDGKTIAALRVQPVGESGLPDPAPSAATPQTEVRLIFVDVASGKTRSEPVVRLSLNFVNAVLAYFDQYALSHRVWAPDSSSILLPETDDGGANHVVVRFPDGEPPIQLDGEIGFWSP